jgi:hypothetical protein
MHIRSFYPPSKFTLTPVKTHDAGGGFVRINLRKLEFTLSGGFTGSYLEDDPSGYVSLGLYRTC